VREFAGAGALNPSICARINRLKTLHKYLVGQVLVATLLTVAVFTVVLLVGNGLKEILMLLVSGQIRFGLLCRAMLYLIPFVWIFALPMGLLTATLLVFGRFSADQELTAARASGVSLLSLVTPVLLLSLLGCGLSAWFNLEIGPRSRVAYIQLTGEVKSELLKNVQLPEGRFIRDIPHYIFYVGKNHGGELENVMIYQLQDETNVDSMLRAARGKMLNVNAANQLVLQLFDAQSVTLGPHGNMISSSPTLTMNFSPMAVTNRVFEPKISDMTFGQLRKKLTELENLSLAPIGTNSPAEWRGQLAALRQQQKDFTEPVRVEMHRQIAFSFACFGFTLVGIPLGIRVHRRETNIGVALALGLVVVYYAFIMLGESLSSRPEFYPHLILWLPNFIFQAVGAVLLWRANRGI
jgi:lipopolysaccharide export system permease protein